MVCVRQQAASSPDYPALLSFILANLIDPDLRIRRHSFSAPARLSVSLISDCLERVNNLSHQVSGLSSRARDDTIAREKDCSIDGTAHLVVAILDQIVNRAMASDDENLDNGGAKSKPRICHQCHTPIDEPTHGGVPCGVGRCTLEHWHGCEGGIEGGKDGRGKSWAACTEDTDYDSDSGSEKNEDLKINNLPKTVLEAAELLAASLGQDTSVVVDDSESSSDDEELREQRLELERLRVAVEKESLQAAAKVARSEDRRRKRDQKKLEVAQQMKVLQEQQTSMSRPPPGSKVGGTSTGTTSKVLKDKVAEHEAKKQRKAAAKKAEQQLKLSGVDFSMAGIRALPDVRKEVEGYITQLKSIIPTLSSDPTASGFSSKTFQPESVLHGGGSNKTPAKKYIYVTELGRAVPVVDTIADLSATCMVDEPDTDSECSADESCPIRPETGTRFKWKKHKDGRKFFKTVLAREKSPEMMVSYEFDEVSGNYEQVLVPKPKQVEKAVPKLSHRTLKTPRSSSQSVRDPDSALYKDLRVASTRGVRPITRREERQPTFVSGDLEKQGKDRMPSLVQFARVCPVSWTGKVTSSTMNPVLFSWAYVSELLATRTGMAPSLQSGELEARLQHFLSVMEVTLQTTSITDFASESWKVSRLYHQKVQDKVDTGVYTWLELSDQWGTATLPHELMAANAELAPKFGRRKAEKSPQRREKSPQRKEKRREEEEKRGPCTTWNNSDTRGKCKWEQEVEGRKCRWQHICSWCKAELNQTSYHQKTFCKKRQEKEAE